MGFERQGYDAVLAGGAEKVWMAVAWSVFLLVGVALLTGDVPGDFESGVLLTAFSLWALVRLVRAQVRTTPDRLLIRGRWRTRHLRWDEVAGAEVVPANAGTNLFGILRVTLVNGRSIKVDGVGDWLPRRDPSTLAVTSMAAEINQRVAAA